MIRIYDIPGDTAKFLGNLIRHPYKTTLNTFEGIKSGLEYPDNSIVTGAMGAGGLIAAFVGAVNRDPLLTSIGLSFASAAGGIYEPRGAKLRTEAHAASTAANEAVAPKEEAVPDPKEEKPAAEKTPAVAEPTAEEPVGRFGKAPVFKPNLPRPTGLDGP